VGDEPMGEAVDGVLMYDVGLVNGYDTYKVEVR
jgi:hypothetical protein